MEQENLSAAEKKKILDALKNEFERYRFYKFAMTPRLGEIKLGTVPVYSSDQQQSIGHKPMNDINDSELKKVVAEELKLYKALRVAVKNRVELKEYGIDKVFPNVVERGQEKELKYKQVHRALTEVLDDNQRIILEKKYLGNAAINDLSIYLDMGLTKDQYYIQKKQAIRLLATALGII